MVTDPSIKPNDGLDELTVTNVDPFNIESTLSPPSKKHRRNHELSDGADELDSPFPQEEHFNPRPSRSRATNNSQSGLLIPEDFSKRPEALVKLKKKKKKVEEGNESGHDAISNKRRKTTASEHIEINSSGNSSSNEEGTIDATKSRKRKAKDHGTSDAETPLVAVTQQSNDKQSAGSGKELKSSEIAKELERAGERLFEVVDGAEATQQQQQQQQQQQNGAPRKKKKKKKVSPRSVVANSDDEEEEGADEEDEGNEEDACRGGDGITDEGDDHNDDDDDDDGEDFDFDEASTITRSTKSKKRKNESDHLWDFPEHRANDDEEEDSAIEATKNTTRKEKKKKGRPKKPSPPPTESLGQRKPEPNKQLETPLTLVEPATTKKARGRPKKKTKPEEEAPPPPARKLSANTPLSEEDHDDDKPEPEKVLPAIDDEPIPEKNSITNDCPTREDSKELLTLTPSPNIRQPEAPAPAPASCPPTSTIQATGKPLDHQGEKSPLSSSKSRSNNAQVFGGVVRVGLSKRARIQPLLKIVRK